MAHWSWPSSSIIHCLRLLTIELYYHKNMLAMNPGLTQRLGRLIARRGGRGGGDYIQRGF